MSHANAAAIAFGPIPSRRLGQSLGINNIPPKHCTYSCVYCQVGPTEGTELARREFYDTAEVVGAVTRKVAELRAAGERIDHLSFVPDGEPTLDVNLGAEIRALEPLGIPIAVITSGALLWMPDVRADLAAADLVSVKVDATVESVWRRVDRPNGRIDFATMQEGVLQFAREYKGELLTDTMLVAGMNDDEASLEGVASFLEKVAPRRAYLAIPTRPPADARVHPPDD
ncbi:MAG TPA: radical SAM protein, partial [Candidatus Eisenbacteria bacterium]